MRDRAVRGDIGGMRPYLAIVVAVFTACTPPASRLAPIPALPFVLDSARVTVVADGVTHRFLYSSEGPWAIQLLDVALDRCTAASAVKGFAGAVGRERTSTLLQRLDDSVRVLGGVNADFFLFTPPGVPTNAHIRDGELVTGPSARPVLAFDTSGVPWIGVLEVAGRVDIGNAHHVVHGWNRGVPDGLALFDHHWGSALDTASGVIEVVLDDGTSRRVVAVDTAPAGAKIAPGGMVLVAGREAPADVRAAIGALRPGDRVTVTLGLRPLRPEEAVGGHPVLLRDSAITPAARDSNAFAVTRHPRTAVGVGDGGRRLLLVVVDGRQAPWSAGMSLLELATLMQSLGAREAINLDGGGSTAMVVRDPESGALRVVNRPSDREGERAVGNALAIVRRC